MWKFSHFSWVHTKKQHSGITGYYVKLLKESSNYFPQQLYHFLFLPAMRVPVSLHFHQHFLHPFFKVLATAVGIKQYLIMVLVCISLTANNDDEHLFTCYWPFVCLLWKNVSNLWPIFFNWVSFYFCVLRVPFIFWILSPHSDI